MTQELHGVISLGGTVIGGSLYQRGLKGETGVGIESVVMTEDYDLTITYTDGEVVTIETGLDTYKALLEGYKSETYSYMLGAINSASSAYSSAQSASGSASDASTYAGQAYNHASSAQTAQTAAETAQGKAEDAQEAAETAQGLAETAQTAAETAQGKAEYAQEAAETAQTAAESSASSASTSETNASTSASTATTKASEASTSATAAAASALKSEGYAVGEQNGTPVTSGSPYYHNNAKYYSENLINILPTDTASGSIASFPDGSDLFDYLSCIVNIEPVQAGSGTPSPDNVRPITGWTGCEVDVSGVNVWDEEWELGGINETTGQKTVANDTIRSKNYISVIPNTNYYVKTGGTTYVNNIVPHFYDAEYNYISYINGIRNAVITTPSNAKYILFRTIAAYGTTYLNDISINYPSTDHDYHAYNPNSAVYPVSWQTEAGTVYGGTVDLVSGVLTVDRASVGMGDMAWSYSSGNGLYAFLNDMVTGKTTAPLICSAYKTSVQLGWGNTQNYEINCNITSGKNTAQVILKDSNYTSASDFQTAMTGQTIVYELATPQTYQLDPTTIQTLLGPNNVWADCGSIEEVKYKADVQKWVEKQLREINTAILALS